jgi:hypothetical protein
VSGGWIVVRGETLVTLEAAAECYRVEVAWVREVYRLGLLGPGEPTGATFAVDAGSALDRLAEVIRLHRHQGLQLEEIERFLDLLRGSRD